MFVVAPSVFYSLCAPVAQYAVYQLYSMEEGANSLANFTTLLSRHFDSVPSWGDVKVQEYTAELHAAAKQRLEDLAGSPEKKACYWRDYVLNEVQTQAVWESLEKGVTALLSKVEASLPKPVLVQVTSVLVQGYLQYNRGKGEGRTELQVDCDS